MEKRIKKQKKKQKKIMCIENIGDLDGDTNCNGIYGVDNITGRPYEDLYCTGTGQMGTVVLGDSAGAHFHIPPEWFNVTEQDAQVFEQMYFVLLS